MAKKVVCECGVVIRGSDDDELVANVQRHGREAHGMEVTREQALAMAEPE
jgi:predicted small metal-binding protein